MSDAQTPENMAVSAASAAASSPAQPHAQGGGSASAASSAAASGQAPAAGDKAPAPGHATLLKAGADPEAEAARMDGEYQAQRQRLEADYKKEWSQTVKQWRQQAQDDPEIGGGKLPVTVQRAQLALNRFDPDGTLGGWLAESGYGNHPEVLRFFNRVAEALAEDSVVTGRGSSERLPLEERMYGHWNP